MNEFPPDVHLAVYGSDRFPKPSPFAEHGYLFTVPGNYPDDTPAHTNVTDWEMAVYRTTDDADKWEVRDVNGNRRVWATGGSRRETIGLAFLEIARLRRIQAAEIGRKREAAGLEPVPPYAVEITNSVTLVIAPTTIAVLERIEPAEGDAPARYHVHDAEGGESYVIREADEVTLRTTTIGVLHTRCDHNPEVAARFEDEPGALIYAEYGLSTCWPCDQLPED
ncbi:hypothetical protein DIZ27_43130 [Streptomyces sp. NWU339]|uniref:hypothetical protein n=1 Tax=Streptomyces sp. NWU339 TaxID=2185284 RepID=UPI000D67576C|nr:hypothetical protein [Streptomyces sp. NWU339]PWI04798.1 hypothetical protein DIZ27_43130 [Streptomyces sp. NWU339]